jgi:hypothetical protein
MGGNSNERKKWKKVFSSQKISAMIHVCAFSQFNEPWEKDFFTGEYKSKVQFQYELLCELFKNSEHVTGLDEITDIPFYLLFNKKDVFLEEIRKYDIGCCFSDCPDDLKLDKNEILKSRRALKKQIKQSEIFEKGKKSEENPLIQNLSEDELLSIFSFFIKKCFLDSLLNESLIFQFSLSRKPFGRVQFNHLELTTKLAGKKIFYSKRISNSSLSAPPPLFPPPVTMICGYPFFFK